ncbi:MAG: formylglycine-generating enzyme family protein [Acidobacteria bacterium]|nr:formylglycine-generating enzyme family protein [Acidobacteriota bacterium]
MLGQRIDANRNLGFWCRMVATGTALALIASLTVAQVVIVPSRLRAPRSTGKTKSKPKKKSQVAMVQPAQQTAELAGVNPPAPKLSFTITPPTLAKPEPAAPETLAKPKPAPELLGYEFDVIRADERGKLVERRKERARFYVEDAGGGVTLEMVELPAGAFVMGSNPNELEQIGINYGRALSKDAKLVVPSRLLAETPQRTVKVAGFHMSKYEITQAQWRAVAGLPKVNHELMSDPSAFKGGNRPVEQVSWEDAVEFCERLSRLTGRRYRLPTEAEWEYACRAGTTWPFSLGETIEPDWVNYDGKQPYAFGAKDAFRQQTVSVGSLGVANAFGLYDMHGNVWEWCLDAWHDSYAGAPVDGSVWQADAEKASRVLRGGAWDSPAGECRSSERKQSNSQLRLNNVGFRVVVEIDAPLVVKKEK